ncbi:hypothetical protein EON65_48135 [archaeon]|nr:MAG: hypothetical protein EON65_48135 [archaeon]
MEIHDGSLGDDEVKLIPPITLLLIQDMISEVAKIMQTAMRTFDIKSAGAAFDIELNFSAQLVRKKPIVCIGRSGGRRRLR